MCTIIIDKYDYDLVTIIFELNYGLGYILSWTPCPYRNKYVSILFFLMEKPSYIVVMRVPGEVSDLAPI